MDNTNDVIEVFIAQSNRLSIHGQIVDSRSKMDSISRYSYRQANRMPEGRAMPQGQTYNGQRFHEGEVHSRITN